MSGEGRQTERDLEQDEMIRRNAESIRRNEEAILRQTKALEQIRDHYFPKRTVWSQLCGAFLKAVGAVTVAAGILEAAGRDRPPCFRICSPSGAKSMI